MLYRLLLARGLMLIGFVVLTSVPVSAAEPLRVVAPADVISSYHSFVKDRAIEDVRDFDHDDLWRDVVELVIFHQALKRGGYEGSVTLLPSNSHKRILRELLQGNVDISGVSIWLEDVRASQGLLLMTQPLIRKGEYRVGLYTSDLNRRALSVTQREDLRDLSVVSTPQWSGDWTALQAMPWGEIHQGPNINSMMRMVGAGRVDVVLMAFRSDSDFAIDNTRHDYRLIPIPNVAVQLSDSRHWVASANTKANVLEPLAALERGLAEMREQGSIERAYQMVGVLDERVQDWQLLNTELSKASD